jgi:hypothetical protein
VSFDPRGKALAIGTATGIVTLDVPSGAISTLSNTGDAVTAVSYNAPGNRIVAVSGRNTRILDPDSRELLASVTSNQGLSRSWLAGDGRSLLSVGGHAGSGLTQVRSLDTDDLIHEACGLLTRNLTPAERARYLSSVHGWKPPCQIREAVADQ